MLPWEQKTQNKQKIPFYGGGKQSALKRNFSNYQPSVSLKNIVFVACDE